MLDQVRSPYRPREKDCTGKPECWPFGSYASSGPVAAVPVDALETLEMAGSRVGVKEGKLRRKARELALLPGYKPRGTVAQLPASIWNAVAALCVAEREASGPKPDLTKRRTPSGCESLIDAALRIGMDSDALRVRAARHGKRYIDGITRAEWDAIAGETRRRRVSP